MERSVLFINCLMYLTLFFYAKRKSERFQGSLPFSMLVMGIYVLSSFFSILYYDSFLYVKLTEKKHLVTLLPLIYLFVVFVIYSLPLIRYKYKSYQNEIKPIYCNGVDMIFLCFAILGIVSVVPFVENLIKAIGMSGQNMADVYFDKQTAAIDVRGQLSSVGRFCNGIVSWFEFFLEVGLFYVIQKRKHWFWILLITLGVLNSSLIGIISGGRGALFQSFCILIFNYMVFRKSLSQKINRIICVIGISILMIFALVLCVMTFARAAGDNELAISGIYRYLGENFVDFSETGWYVRAHTNGHSMFNGTGYTFMKEVSDYFDSRDWEWLCRFTGIRMYVYYTMMGDAYIDYGLWGGILFFAVLALLFCYATRNKENRLSSIVLLSMYAKIGFNGIYHWLFMYKLEYLCFTLLVVFLLRMVENRALRKRPVWL